MFSPMRVWTLVLAGFLFGPSAAAQEGSGESAGGRSTAAPIRQIYVPADEPTSWPAGDWVPVASEELRELLAHSEPAGPPAAYLERALYKARLSGTTLVGGTLEASARLRSPHPQFVDLGRPSLAISRLHWSGREAVWGLSDDTRSLLRVDEDGAGLAGRWSLAGRRVFSTIEFDLQVLPATVSQLELELPEAREVTIAEGLISRVAESHRPGWKIWHIDLGRRTSGRLVVSGPAGSSRTSTNELQVSQTSTYSFVDSDLRIQTDITIQSVAGKFETVEVVAPPAMTFSSITVGNERVLPAWRKQDQQRSLLVIDVSAIKLTPATRLRLRGQLPLRPGAQQGLPRLGLLGARLLQMRRQVRILNPLQLKDLDLSDSRLVNSTMGPDSGAALELDDLSPASQIRVTVATPQPDLSASVLGRVDWQQSDPQLRTELNVEALTGSTYSLVCDVPVDWEVTRVDAGSTMPVAQWQTSWDADSGRNQLFVEFRNALSPQSPVRISILARPRAASPGQSIPIPVVMPRVSGERHVAVVMTLPPGVHVELPADSDYQAIDLADLVAERPELGEDFTEIRDSRLLVVQAADPGDDQQLTVHTSQQGAGEASGTISPASSTAATDPSSTDTSSPEALAVVREPIRAAIDVLTLVATERGRLCRNHVVLHLPPVAGPRTLRLELPNTVRLLTAQSRLPVSTTSREVVVELPSSPQAAEVTLAYESPLERSLLSGQAQIPLPRWDGEPTVIAWQIEIPDALRLRNPTEGSTALGPPSLNWSQRILGPLGRLPGGETFWPFSASAWRSLSNKASGIASPMDESQRSFRSLAGEREALSLAFWDVSSARRLGWIMLLISLLLAAWPFQQERLLRRGWTLKLVLIGIAAALLAPDMLAIPWGGFIMGGAIGALLPERWRTPRRREVREERSTFSLRTRLSVTATTGILLLSCLLEPVPCRGWQTASEAAGANSPAGSTSEDSSQFAVLIPLDADSAQTQFPPHVYVDRTAAQRVLARRITSPPSYLLRSADYEVDDFAVPRPNLTARYDVVLLQPESETRVVLALTGVQFPDAQLCRVDGVPAPLLPHRSGEGVVVVVPAGAAADDGQEASVQVELLCQPRPAADDERPRLALGIPQVVASQLLLHSADSSSPEIEAVRAGSFTHQKSRGGWRIVLGGQGHLIVHPTEKVTTRRWLEPVSAASVIEAHPMRLRIDSRLVFRPRPQWARLDGRTLRLQLPSGSVVLDVRADGLLHTQSARNGRSPVQLDLLFVEDVPPDLNIDLSFDLPAGRPQEGAGVVIPPLPFLIQPAAVEFPVHRIGVAGAPGFRLSGSETQISMPATTGIDESQLPAWRGSRTARASESTYQLTASRSLEIPLVPIEPSVNTSIRQTLTVRSATVNWAATLQMKIRDAPLALHRLQIDPRVNVRQVSVIQESVERLASWSRTAPENLLLFLKEELSGTQTIHLKGSLAVDDRYDFVIPSLSVEGASLSEPPEVVIQHAAGLGVVVAAEDGTVVAGGSETPSSQELVQLPTLNHDPTLPPLRIQRDRSEPGLDIEQMTIVESLQQSEVRWTRLVRIDTSRMPQQTLTVDVAATPPQIQLAASSPMAEEVVDGVTRLTLDLSTADSDAVDVTIAGRTPLASGTLPEIRVAGEPLPRHLMVTLEGVEVAVEGRGEPVIRDNLTSWAQDNLAVLERPIGQLLEMAQGPVQFAPAIDAGADAWLQRLNAAIWLQPDGHRRGVTVADITALRRANVELTLPPQVKLEFVELDGKSISPISPDAVEIPASQMSQRLVLWWTDATTEGEGLPLPLLRSLTGATPHAVLFGTNQHIYMIDEAVQTIPLAELHAKLSAVEQQADSASPILRALRAAGVGDQSLAGIVTTTTTHAVQLNERRDVIPVHLIDQQLVKVLGLLLVAGGVLVVWFLLGRWNGRIARAAGSVSGLPGLALLAAAVWLLGASWLGLLLLVLVIGLWMLQIRRPPAREEQDSRLQTAH
jgi:hypothetical protein